MTEKELKEKTLKDLNKLISEYHNCKRDLSFTTFDYLILLKFMSLLKYSYLNLTTS